jgi:outer membrane protein assembly factor BamA
MQRVQTQFPAAKNESSQSAITSLRFHRHWDSPDTGIQTFEAGYNLRAATKILSSDFVYARHFFNARYSLKAGQELLNVTFLGGVANGQIPLFDRFMLGNSTTLRGYNKYDVAPLGGNRMAVSREQLGRPAGQGLTCRWVSSVDVLGSSGTRF